MENLVWLPFALFMFVMLFGIFIFPLLLVGYIRVRSAQNNREKQIGYIALAAPVAGLVLYMTIDMFEAANMAAMWWVLMLLLVLIPLVLASISLAKSRHTILAKTSKKK
jgi:hypothetical protein